MSHLEEPKEYSISIVSTKSTHSEESLVQQLIEYWNKNLGQEQGISLRIVPLEECKANIYLFLVSDQLDESQLETVINNPDPIVIFYRTPGSSKAYELNRVINKFEGRCTIINHSSPNEFSTKLLELLRYTAKR